MSLTSRFETLRPLRLPFWLTIVLGLTLDLTGAQHVYGISALNGQKLATGTALLLVAIATGWLFVGTSNHPIRPPGPQAASGHVPTIDRGVLVVLISAAWLATSYDGMVFLALGSGIGTALGFGLGAVALLAALLYGRGVRWPLAIAILLGSLVRLVSFHYVPIDPPHGDMLPLVQGALDNLLAGQSPYTTYRMPWKLPLTYLPLTWLAYLPPRLLDLDIRLTNLVAELAVGAALLWTGQRPRGAPSAASRPPVLPQLVDTHDWPTHAALLWVWTFLQPTAIHWSQSTTAPVTWALLAWTAALLANGSQGRAALLLGLCAAATPLASVVAPFALLRWTRAYGWRKALALGGVALLVSALWITPFLIWSPEQFILGAFRWFNDNTLFPRLRWEMDNTWARMVGFGGMFWRRGLEDTLKPIQLLLLLGLAALYWLRKAPASRLAPFLAAAFLLFTVFNPVLWPYLYNPALVAALVALANCYNVTSEEQKTLLTS